MTIQAAGAGERETLDPALVPFLIERYAALGLYEKRDGDRAVILRDAVVDPVVCLLGPESADGEPTIAELRELALSQGVPLKAGETDDELADRLFTFTASDETTDRYGDRILVDGTVAVGETTKRFGKGWMLKEYELNPVFLAFHNHREMPLGRALKTWTDVKGSRKRLRQAVLFDDGTSNPAAPLIANAYRSKLMSTVSVGFWPVTYHNPQDPDERKVLGLGPYGVLFATQILWEDSAVSIPANPNARLEKGYDVSDHARRMLTLADELKAAGSDELAARFRDAYHRLGTLFDVGAAIERAAAVTVAPTVIVGLPEQERAALVRELVAGLSAATPALVAAIASAPAPADPVADLVLDLAGALDKCAAPSRVEGRERAAVDDVAGPLGSVLARIERAAERIESAVVRYGEIAGATPAPPREAPSPYEALFDVVEGFGNAVPVTAREE